MCIFDYGKVKDPEYFSEGRCEAHSDHVVYASWEEYREKKSSFYVSLDGLWKFAYARNYGQAVPGFEAPAFDCSGWDDIRVPASIQMEGWDIPQYVNVQYPWDGREEIVPGEIPEKFNPVASYVKVFTVPERMKKHRLFLSFQGAESGLAVWMNGNFVGYSFHRRILRSLLMCGKGKISWRCRCLNGPLRAGARIRIFTGFLDCTGACICMQYRKFMYRISGFRRFWMKNMRMPGWISG